ncbi:hypothetical protein AM501_16290 [Aneurinibacillus migulanus]|uniref:DUF6583 family protein n=1 Tax=Aneurinibacillus migulanus TaxID=47500 RepID=UPI0005B82A40|nr:DUF6583 family protein [Aneurinibacillus migulanus]KIV51470.1 hypothetical protein TS64_23845 [Aneurinibacillus migulanus]KPD07284.1 hypothetical protein AM501_16290 [Aneurinibacillus migulanus]CEH31394.1 Uncharacterized protein BN1090_A2_03869 [Aneurinibacillus migulanus]
MVSKGKMPIILAVIAVLVIGGGLYTAYAFFDVFKSNKTIYLEAEAQEMQNFSKVMEEYEKSYNEYAQPYLEGGVEQKMEISNLVLDMPTTDPQMAKVMGILKDAKLVTEAKVDDKNNKNYSKIDLNIKNNNIVGAELFYDAEKVGFGVPVIYNKYGYFNWKDRGVMEQRYGLTGLPKRVPSSKDYMELVKVPREELRPIIAEYAKLYADSIQDKQIIVNKKATFEEQGVKLAAKEITVTFTPEEHKQLLKKIVDKISKDTKLQDLLYPRYEKLAEMSATGTPQDMPKLTKEEFKKKFTKFKEDADRSIDKGEVGEGMKMVIYADKKHNILSRTIETTDKKTGEKAVFKLASFQDKENKDHVVFDVTTDKSGDTGKVSIVYVNKKEGENQKGSVKLSTTDKIGETTKSDFTADAAFTITKEGNKQNQDVKVDFKDNQQAQATPFTLTWKGTVTDNDKDKARTSDYKIEFTGPQNDPSMPKKIAFTMKSDEKFNVANVKLPELNAQNSINMATVTDQELMQVQQEIQNGGMQFMMKNMQLFQQLGLIPADAGPMMQ